MPSPQSTSFSNTRKVLSQLENLLKCTVCKNPATSPVTLGGCEHIFCSVCCENYLGRCCPVCDLPAHVKDADVDRQLFNMATLCGRLKEILDDIKDKDINKPDLVGDSIYCTPDQGIIDTEPVVGPYKNTEADFTQVIEKTSKTDKKTNKRKGKEREEDKSQASLKETGKAEIGRDFREISAMSVDDTNVEHAMQKGPSIEKNLKPTKSTRKKQKTREEKLPEAVDKVGQNLNLTSKSVRNRRKGVRKKVEHTVETEGTDVGAEIENERTITEQSLNTNEATSANLLSESKPYSKKDELNITCKSRKSSRQRKSTGSIEKHALCDSYKTVRNRAVKRYSLQSSATETLMDQTCEEQQIHQEENEPTTILKKKTRRSKAISVNMTESGTSEISQKRKPADMNTSILPDVTGPDDNKTRKKKRWTLNGQVQGDKSEQGAPLESKRKEKENSNTSTVKAKSRRVSSPGLNKRNAKGETLLHVAAIKNDIPKVLELLEKGANPNVRDNAGWTPLHEACNHGYTHVAKLLLDHGAMMNVPGFENDSPLHDAVSNNRLDCVQLLVSRGASTSARNLHGLTPIDYAKTREMKEALNSQVTEPMETDKETIDVLEYQQPCLLGTGLSREEKTMLQKTASQLKVKLTEEVSAEVTHIVTKCNTEGMCPRTVKIVQGILSGKWILNLEWLTLCREMNSLVCEEAFEVQGLSMFPYCKSPCKGRMNRKQQLPGLFDGCWFYFHGDFEYAVPSKEDLSATIKIGGGKILTREPKPGHLDETTLTVPYHADSESELKACCTLVIFETGSKHQPIRTKYICSVPASWVIDCAATFTLLPLPES